LKKFSPALLVALDCGIGNFKEVKLAKKLKLEVIIIDHHEILDKIPAASIVVDPKQEGDKYPFKGLAAVGLAFKLAELLLGKKMTDTLKKNFLELVALATLADMMPKEDENIIFIAKGLNSLENSWRPGLQVILSHDYFKEYLSLEQKISKFISILNVRDVKDRFPATFRLLAAPSREEADLIMEELIKKNEFRRERIEVILAEAESRLSAKIAERIIFEGKEDWDYILISIVASILSQKYKKPTFIYKKMEKESLGTVRVPRGVNSVALMKKCKKLLITYGGHPQASGFRLKNGNLEEFKKCLIKNYKT
ncbi:MAG: DHHA1 domain-containing protein, partial [bacterium]|nr:DHHA1 domain-containing protein [bacterium]